MIEKLVVQKYSASMFRKGTYAIEEVLSKRVDVKTPKNLIRVEFDGDLVKMNSQRYELFDIKGTKCVTCKIEGKYFAKERTHKSQPFHFNLYAINEQGEEVLMTKDHIHPRSKGGEDHIDNYQTMCTICNFTKGITTDIE